MDLTASGRTWDDASSPAATRLARRYEAAWRSANGERPNPCDYLPADPAERQGALLALLRTDLALRWERDEHVSVEWYRERHPDLSHDGLVALIYEEFCLREEAGETPDEAEYRARFPEVASHLKRVFDIHGLVGSAPATAFQGTVPAVPFPEVGQTIAGFRLVEELGRGAFARVFRAEERQLADRPVALKVARAGSREPQTLARLQHTNIVPVHSYRTDPVTGLHLLCMPFFGRVTLAQILADPATRAARSGADLVAVLDRLQPPTRTTPKLTMARSALTRRTYARAIAWWGARMAEALQHAHDRGVLHRDIKPSNVLVTAEGMPMLLDFNLAQESWVDDPTVAPATLGGTLAYMAPEHLEALADGGAEVVDSRADLYALGVVLYEALGSRPFTVPTNALTITEAMLRAAEERRRGAPLLRRAHPDVPPALASVVQKCLAPNPADRYDSAADLAADLQAVADDAPLRFAREPQPSRTVRWLRRNKARLAMTAAVVVPLVTVLGLSTALAIRSQVDRIRLESSVKKRLDEAEASVKQEDFEMAMFQFDSARQMAQGRPGLENLFGEATDRYYRTGETRKIRRAADVLFQQANVLRSCLLSSDSNLRSATEDIKKALQPFYVLQNENWLALDDLTMLDERRRDRLPREVNEILFLWVWALDNLNDEAMVRGAIATCDRALLFATPEGPWQALRDRYAAALSGQRARSRAPADPGAETSALACFQWSLLSDLDGRRDWAIAWLERAVQLEPGNYWYHDYLASNHERAGHIDQAREHYEAAVVANPESPWARHNRARLYRSRGSWDRALVDLQEAIRLAAHAQPAGFDFVAAHLDLGYVHQALGNETAARAEYDYVAARGAPYARAARLNRAKLDYEGGSLAQASEEFTALLSEDPGDAPARLARAMLAMRMRQAERADADLSVLVEQPTPHRDIALSPDFRVQALALRALARLAEGRLAEAEADAAEALRLDDSPSHQRLWARTLVAVGRARLLQVDDPEEIALWPLAGPALTADLRSAAERLGTPERGERAPSASSLLVRAVLLSALNEPRAFAEADRAVERSHESSRALRIRARIRRRAGDRPGAWRDVERALALDPDDPRLIELRGCLQLDEGRAEAALADFDRAIRRGTLGTVRRLRAQALMALKRPAEALDAWTLALTFDPEDPRAYLGRARAFLLLHKFDQALADLEQAAGWAGDRPEALVPLTVAYASCLAQRPNRLPRVLSLARRAWSATLAGQVPRRAVAALSGL